MADEQGKATRSSPVILTDEEMRQSRLYDRDSYAPLLFEMQLRSGWAHERELIPLPAYNVLQSFSVVESSASDRNGSWTATLELFERDETAAGVLEELIFLPGKVRGQEQTLEIRWAWDNRPNPLKEAPIYIARILKVEPTFTVEGLGVSLTLASSTWMHKSLFGMPADLKFPSGTNIGTAFKMIAEKVGWTEIVVESTDSATDSGLAPTRETYDATRFINKLLAPKAFNEHEEPFRFFFDRYGRAHFHSEQFGYQGHDLKKVRVEYRFAKDSMGEVISFEPEDNGFFTAYRGGGDAFFASLDSKGGDPVTYKVTPEEGVDGHTAGRAVEGTVAVPDLRPDGLVEITPERGAASYVRLSARTDKMALVYAKRFYAWAVTQRIKAKLSVKGTHKLGLLDHINVWYYTHGGVPHYLSGTYMVTGVTHNIGSEGWTTDMDLQRTGLPQGVVEDMRDQNFEEFGVDRLEELPSIAPDTWAGSPSLDEGDGSGMVMG